MLGRYRFVKPGNLRALNANHSHLTIRFMTVHASKGLEADHVVILRMEVGIMGFPSEVADDPLLDLVLPKPERFEHAEERRLFYVALTRARKSVTIFADRERPSAFSRELIKDSGYQVFQLDHAGTLEHRCGNCGGRLLAHTTKKGRSYYACEHAYLCGQKLAPCGVCGQGLPKKDKANPDNFTCKCDAVFPTCPKCSNGWLVERQGKYGKFLGCSRYPSCTGKSKFQR